MVFDGIVFLGFLFGARGELWWEVGRVAYPFVQSPHHIPHPWYGIGIPRVAHTQRPWLEPVFENSDAAPASF